MAVYSAEKYLRRRWHVQGRSDALLAHMGGVKRMPNGIRGQVHSWVALGRHLIGLQREYWRYRALSRTSSEARLLLEECRFLRQFGFCWQESFIRLRSFAGRLIAKATAGSRVS